MDPVTDPADPPQLLHVEVQQLVGSLPFVAPQRLGGRLALAERADIRFHDVRQQSSAHSSMRRVELAPNRGSEPMHRPQTRIGQRQPPKQAGHRHIQSSRRVAAMLKSRL